ncbi:MAG: tetratricopeptide repeat protein, partial [Terriglobales bacterium]
MQDASNKFNDAYERLMDWTVLDRFHLITNDVEERTKAAAILIRDLNAQEKFAQMVSERPSVEGLQVLEAILSPEECQSMLPPAMVAMAERDGEVEPQKSKELYEKAMALTSSKKTLNEMDQLVLLRAMQGLAKLCAMSGDSERASKLLADMASKKELLGKENFSAFADCFEALAQAFKTKDGIENEIECYKKKHETLLQADGDDLSGKMAENLIRFADLLVQSGRIAEAEPAYRKAFETVERQTGSSSPQSQEILRKLGRLYLELEFYDQAITCWTSLLGFAGEKEDMKAIELCVSSLEQIAEAKIASEDYASAADLHKHIADKLLRVKLTNRALAQLRKLVHVYEIQNDEAQLQKVQERIYELLKLEMPSSAASLINTVLQLADSYRSSGKESKIEIMLLESLSLCDAGRADSSIRIPLIDTLAKLRMGRG